MSLASRCHRGFLQTVFSDGRVEVSDQSIIGQCNPSSDGGFHHTVPFCQLTDRLLTDGRIFSGALLSLERPAAVVASAKRP